MATPVVLNNGVRGPQGQKGDSGSDGIGIKVLGTKATTGALPGSGNTLDDAWIVTADDSLYVWTGTAWAGPLTFDAGSGVPTPTGDGKVLTATGSSDGDFDWENPTGGVSSWADIVALGDFPAAIGAGASASAARTAIGAQAASTAITTSDTATTSEAGIVELAAHSDVTTGTDDTKAVTSGGVKAATDALVASDTLVQTDTGQNTGLERKEGTTGPVWSVLDSTGAYVALGIDRTGSLVVNGTQQKLGMPWQEGGTDPTVGGTKALPAGVMPIFMLTDIDNLPSWASGYQGIILVASAGDEEVVTGQFYGNGLSNGHALAVSDGGTGGDTTVSALNGTGAMTAQTDEGTVSPAIKVVTSATTKAAEFNNGTAVGTASQRTISLLLKTPASFSAATAFMQWLLGSTLGGRISFTSTGALRISDSTPTTQWTASSPLSVSTWYHVLITVTQGAGSTGIVRVRAWARGNTPTDTPLFDSGNIGSINVGASHDTLWFGTAASGTVTYYWANARWNEDATSYLGNG